MTAIRPLEQRDLPELTLGYQVAKWMESNLVHGPGDVMGSPYRLDADQLRFLVHAYAVDRHGRRLYDRATYSRPKGCAKSELAAGVSHAELDGPVRALVSEDGFAVLADANDATLGVYAGDPIGVPVVSPSIPMAATTEDQAEETIYGAFRHMASPEHAARLDIGLQRTYKADGTGRALLVTSSSVSKDGGKPSFQAKDEPHLWTTPELRRLNATMERNARKRLAADPWSMSTTTSFAPGEESVAELERLYAEKVANGEIIDARLLYDHREAPANLDLDRPDQLRQAIIAARGAAASYTNVEAIMRDWADPTVDEADFRRYWLNQVVAATNAWMPPERWKQREDRSRRVMRSESVALGFDGSLTEDATGLIACSLERPHLFVLGAWENPGGVAGKTWQVPQGEVDAAVHDAFNRFDVARFYANPSFWQDWIEKWALEHGSERVAKWPTRHLTKTAVAVERLHTAVGTSGVTHDGNAMLARHVANARRRRIRGEHGEPLYILQKDPGKPQLKIDLAYASLLAYEARCDAVAAGYRKRSRVPVCL